MLANGKMKARGDTLIEVLFAVAVFSLVAVGGLSIMNQGSATSERALEITLVRQEIDSQAETLRFLNASYNAAYQQGTTINDYPANTPAGQWAIMAKSIKDLHNLQVSDFGLTATSTCPTAPRPNGSFIMNTHIAKFDSSLNKLKPANTSTDHVYAYVKYEADNQVSLAEGIWIEAISSVSADINQANADYIDFHIRACWDGPGQSLPVTIGTIVRLYEPRG